MTSYRIVDRNARLAATTFLTAIVLCAGPAVAGAQEVDEASPTGITFGTLPLGFGETIDFRGHADIVTLTVPVPEGMQPASLDASMQLPVNVARGWIDVESNGRLLTRVDVPADASVVPVSLPLDEVPVENDAAVLTLRLNLEAVDDICPEDWNIRSVTLRDSVIRYTGAPVPPAVIADFLPPILERVDLYLPQQPTATESTVALDLAAEITTRYTGRPVQIGAVELPPNGIPPAAENPFTRQIVIRETGEAGTELGAIPGGPPALYLTGDANSLWDQGRLITSAIAGLAVSPDVAAGPTIRPSRLSPDAPTLYDLGINDLETSALGLVETHAYLDQSKFGRPVGDLSIDLKGSYTPLPDSAGGLITVSAGDTVLDTWAADASGIIDRAVTVPDTALRRVTDLTVSLHSTGAQQQCGLQQPVTLRVDGSSRVTSTIADPPVPGGFESLPQTLMPQVDVAATGTGLIDTARAVELVSGLQSLTSTQLDPRWVTIDEAMDSSSPAIIVAADGIVPDELALPLIRTEDRRFEVTDDDGGTSDLTFGTDATFAALQVLRDNGRTILVAMSTDVPAELDRTLAWLDGEPDRWQTLTGDVLFTAQDRDPVALSTPVPESTDTATTSNGVSGTVVVIVAATLAAVGSAATALWAVRSRRRRSHPSGQ